MTRSNEGLETSLASLPENTTCVFVVVWASLAPLQTLIPAPIPSVGNPTMIRSSSRVVKVSLRSLERFSQCFWLGHSFRLVGRVLRWLRRCPIDGRKPGNSCENGMGLLVPLKLTMMYCLERLIWVLLRMVLLERTTRFLCFPSMARNFIKTKSWTAGFTFGFFLTWDCYCSLFQHVKRKKKV